MLRFTLRLTPNPSVHCVLPSLYTGCETPHSMTVRSMAFRPRLQHRKVSPCCEQFPRRPCFWHPHFARFSPAPPWPQRTTSPYVPAPIRSWSYHGHSSGLLFMPAWVSGFVHSSGFEKVGSGDMYTFLNSPNHYLTFVVFLKRLVSLWPCPVFLSYPEDDFAHDWA